MSSNTFVPTQYQINSYGEPDLFGVMDIVSLSSDVDNLRERQLSATARRHLGSAINRAIELTKKGEIMDAQSYYYMCETLNFHPTFERWPSQFARSTSNYTTKVVRCVHAVSVMMCVALAGMLCWWYAGLSSRTFSPFVDCKGEEAMSVAVRANILFAWIALLLALMVSFATKCVGQCRVASELPKIVGWTMLMTWSVFALLLMFWACKEVDTLQYTARVSLTTLFKADVSEFFETNSFRFKAIVRPLMAQMCLTNASLLGTEMFKILPFESVTIKFDDHEVFNFSNVEESKRFDFVLPMAGFNVTDRYANSQRVALLVEKFGACVAAVVSFFDALAGCLISIYSCLTYSAMLNVVYVCVLAMVVSACVFVHLWYYRAVRVTSSKTDGVSQRYVVESFTKIVQPNHRLCLKELIGREELGFEQSVEFTRLKRDFVSESFLALDADLLRTKPLRDAESKATKERNKQWNAKRTSLFANCKRKLWNHETIGDGTWMPMLRACDESSNYESDMKFLKMFAEWEREYYHPRDPTQEDLDILKARKDLYGLPGSLTIGHQGEYERKCLEAGKTASEARSLEAGEAASETEGECSQISVESERVADTQYSSKDVSDAILDLTNNQRDDWRNLIVKLSSITVDERDIVMSEYKAWKQIAINEANQVLESAAARKKRSVKPKEKKQADQRLVAEAKGHDAARVQHSGKQAHRMTDEEYQKWKEQQDLIEKQRLDGQEEQDEAQAEKERLEDEEYDRQEARMPKSIITLQDRGLLGLERDYICENVDKAHDKMEEAIDLEIMNSRGTVDPDAGEGDDAGHNLNIRGKASTQYVPLISRYTPEAKMLKHADLLVYFVVVPVEIGGVTHPKLVYTKNGHLLVHLRSPLGTYVRQHSQDRERVDFITWYAQKIGMMAYGSTGIRVLFNGAYYPLSAVLGLYVEDCKRVRTTRPLDLRPKVDAVVEAIVPTSLDPETFLKLTAPQRVSAFASKTCYNCLMTGHVETDCTKPPTCKFTKNGVACGGDHEKNFCPETNCPYCKTRGHSYTVCVNRMHKQVAVSKKLPGADVLYNEALAAFLSAYASYVDKKDGLVTVYGYLKACQRFDGEFKRVSGQKERMVHENAPVLPSPPKKFVLDREGHLISIVTGNKVERINEPVLPVGKTVAAMQLMDTYASATRKAKKLVASGVRLRDLPSKNSVDLPCSPATQTKGINTNVFDLEMVAAMRVEETYIGKDGKAYYTEAALKRLNAYVARRPDVHDMSREWPLPTKGQTLAAAIEIVEQIKEKRSEQTDTSSSSEGLVLEAKVRPEYKSIEAVCLPDPKEVEVADLSGKPRLFRDAQIVVPEQASEIKRFQLEGASLGAVIKWAEQPTMKRFGVTDVKDYKVNFVSNFVYRASITHEGKGVMSLWTTCLKDHFLPHPELEVFFQKVNSEDCEKEGHAVIVTADAPHNGCTFCTGDDADEGILWLSMVDYSTAGLVPLEAGRVVSPLTTVENLFNKECLVYYCNEGGMTSSFGRVVDAYKDEKSGRFIVKHNCSIVNMDGQTGEGNCGSVLMIRQHGGSFRPFGQHFLFDRQDQLNYSVEIDNHSCRSRGPAKALFRRLSRPDSPLAVRAIAEVAESL